jgi:hypothetical protein
MPTNTYTPLATVTLGSAAASITFATIPATYRDLILVLSGSSATDQSIWLQFNGDTGSNYPWVYGGGNGSSAFAGSGTNTGMFVGSSIGGSYTKNHIVSIMDYSSTNKHKSTLSRDNASSNQVLMLAGRWPNTAAITSVRIFGNGGHNFNSGFTANLYGVIS